MTATSSTSQSTAFENAGSFTVVLGPTTELRPVLMKCQGFSPSSFIVGPGVLPCARAISAMWSV